MPIFTLGGLAAIILGCLSIYAASPNQRWWSEPWPQWPARIAGTGLLLLAWLALAQDMQRLTAAFVFMTTLMLVFVLLPYLGALLHVRRTR
ncbi:hypothetical protein SAMN05192560_0041 [Methylobacillus rhizosphaerae]|uniref:Uncharacterized protein n=1 Tax=Methylobacillus rhizosphaerae TaxID=551994 RepID=A0A238XNI5_9PROT|nr:hypothetical protein [Methylobacillus rhizosphaerae]SNR60101.1 hypothetical protein SAMN05192560_0041 [Methylobacillus rhizosphaerae]